MLDIKKSSKGNNRVTIEGNVKDIQALITTLEDVQHGILRETSDGFVDSKGQFMNVIVKVV